MKKTKIRGLLFSLIGIVVALCACLCLAACKDGKDKPPAPVSEASIRYDGTKFTWEGSQYATKYILLIGENERTTNNTQFGYKSGDDETVTVSITAVNNAGQSEAVTREFTRLATVTELEFDASGVMSWDPVEGASSYEVSINNDVKSVDVTTFDEFKYGDRNAIKVRATGDETTFSFWSDTVNKEYLGVPTDVTYDGQDISWKGYASAKGYTVYVNGSEAGKSDKPNYRYDSQKKSFSVSVVANGDGEDSFDSKHSDEKTYTYLGMVEDMEVDDGILKWNKVDGAEGYKITVNGVTRDVKKNEFELTENLTQAIRIQPYAANTGDKLYFAEWSEEKTYKLLSRPVLRWNSNLGMDGDINRSLYWSVIENCDGYEVRLTDPSGVADIAGRSNRENPSFGHAYRQVGRYKVEVKALAPMGGDTCDSRWSEVMTVERLQAPNADTIPVTSDADNLAKGFTVHFSSVSGANGYRLYREGTKIGTDARDGATSMPVTDILDETATEEQHITYELQSLGSNRVLSGESRVTLDSLLADQGNSSPRTFDVTILARPQNVDISGYTVSWDSVAKAREYSVKTLGNNPDVAKNNSWDLKNITDAVTCDMQICARGDGANTLPSAYTSPIKLVKLAKPTGIKVDTSVENGLISCSAVPNADSYQAFFNGNTNEGVNTATYIDINRYITTDTVTVTMQAVGNYWDRAETKTRYYITSQLSEPHQFTKLKAPTNLRFEGNNLVWSEPTNINNTVSGIRYEVFKDATGTDRYDITKSGTSMSTSSLEGGAAHTFAVKCYGDGSKFLNSDLSVARTVIKRPTPVISRSHGSDGFGIYTWTDAYSPYSISVEGAAPEQISAGVQQYKPKFTSAKNSQQVVFIAVGDNEETINSTPVTITQQVKRLTTLSMTKENVEYISSVTDINGNYVFADGGKIRITLPEKDVNGTGYRIVCGTARTVAEGGVHEIDANVNDYEVRVTALGGRFGSDDVYYYDSEESNAKQIKILAAPNSDSIQHNNGTINWRPASGASGYEITIAYNGADEPYTAKITDGAAFMLSKVVGATIEWKDITSISVRALGNGDTTITSRWAERTIR